MLAVNPSPLLPYCPMKSSSKSDSLFDQILARMSPEQTALFQKDHLEALRATCRQLTWRKHPVDVRFTVPFPSRGFYVVFLAGPERRSPERLRAQHSGYPYGTFASIVTSAVLLGAIATIGILQALRPATQTSQETQAYPTVLPWLQTEADCERSNFEWRNDACWDATHNPDF